MQILPAGKAQIYGQMYMGGMDEYLCAYEMIDVVQVGARWRSETCKEHKL